MPLEEVFVISASQVQGYTSLILVERMGPVDAALYVESLNSRQRDYTFKAWVESDTPTPAELSDRPSFLTSQEIETEKLRCRS